MIGQVVVVGSANVDIVSRVSRIPKPGETVTASSSAVYAGGKGLNQAVAAARGGASTGFVGAIGQDEHAGLILDTLISEQIDTSHLRRDSGATGTAFVTIDDTGENNIVIVAGANGALGELTEQDRELIRESDVLICQLEVPDSVVEQAVVAARLSGTTVILNPAPVRAFPATILEAVDILIVNEHEAQQLAVTALPVPCVLTTLGPLGAELDIRGQAPVRIPARETIAVDSTGAGDTFVGVFAAEIASGVDYAAAARRATVAASLSVEQFGAAPSIPTREAVDGALRNETKEYT